MNNLDNIYKEFGNNFCLCPFVGSFYSTVSDGATGKQNVPNTVRPCSLAKGQFDVINNDILSSINTPVWKDIRKKFVQGQFQDIKECQVCINAERNGGTSPRLGSAHYIAEHAQIDLIEIIQKVINNDYQVDQIFSLDYYPSNYCNYSCIMCTPGASSQRLTFEIQVNQVDKRIYMNSPDSGFFDLLKNVNILNLTGGETVLQKQAIDLLDYLIEHDLAKNITISLLTNASSFPQLLEEKFKKFKKVIYTVSVDGIGDVVEYQRRGADWNTLKDNCVKLVHHNVISTVVNYVLTAINAPSFMDFADWVFDNSIEFISVSSVFQNHLGVGVMPQSLRELCISRLDEGLVKYSTGTSRQHLATLKYIQMARTMLIQTPDFTHLLPKFIEHIRKEDSVSKRKLIEVVPEWAPYFVVD